MGASKRAFNEMQEQDKFNQKQDRSILRIPNVDISKEIIDAEAKKMIESVREGEIDPLKTVAYFVAIERIIKAVKSGIMDDAIDEHHKYGEKTVTVLGGCELSVVESGVRNSFKNTPAWCEIKEREDLIANERKELEATLKTIKKPGMISIDDEIVEANPPIRTSTTTIKTVIK